MELVNEFSVNRSIDETWQILTDVERIVPCLPGAQLDKIEGETYHATVKIKVGPIAASFRGKAHFVERDSEKYFLELKAAGSDTGGKGTAAASVTAQLAEVSPDVTHCVVNTNLSITGKVAQFGRGAMTDISSKMIGQFATNLNSMIESESESDSILDVEPISAGGPVTRISGDVKSGQNEKHQSWRPETVAEPLDLFDYSWSRLLDDKRVQVVVFLIGILSIGLLARRSRTTGPRVVTSSSM